MMGVGYKGKRAMANIDFEPDAREDDWGLQRARDWKLILCMKPRTCFLTGKQLWGSRCYKGTRVITGPGDPVIEDYFIEKFEFMKWQLTRT
jgi:hypothetical protein